MQYPLLLTLLALLTACQSTTEQHSKPAAASAIDIASTKAAARKPAPQAGAADADSTSNSDTLWVSNHTVLRIMPGSNADFSGSATQPKPGITEAHLIRQQAGGRVRRAGHKLLLTLANDKLIALTDDTYELRGDENEEQDKHYQYGGTTSGLPYWIVYETLYEAQHTLLINQRTGIKTAVHGELELSPDHTRILVSYASLVYDDDVSMLQLFAINQQEVQLLWQKSLSTWAPGRTRWLDGSTIAIEQLRLDNDLVNVSHSTYVRLMLSQ